MASLIENMAPEYTTDGAKAGNYYMHSKLLYLCKSDCSGLFDESNFEQVYLSDLLRGTANSNLGNKIISGSITVTAGISTFVEVGFKPSIIIVSVGALTNTSIKVYWAEALGRVFWTNPGSSTSGGYKDLGVNDSYTATSIDQITDTGFYVANHLNGATYHYIVA